MANYNPNTYFDRFISGNQKPKLGIAISTYSEVNTDSKRYEIIQKVIEIKKYKSYLEIGCFKNETFDKINNSIFDDENYIKGNLSINIGEKWFTRSRRK